MVKNVDHAQAHLVRLVNPNKVNRRTVCLTGIAPMMFNFASNSPRRLQDGAQKMCLLPGDSQVIAFPMVTLQSVFSTLSTGSFPKRLLGPKTYKKVVEACRSWVRFSPSYIPFTRDEQSIVFGAFDEDGQDPVSGAYMYQIQDPTSLNIIDERPVLPLPWQLTFELTIYPNREIQEQTLLNLMQEGGRTWGLGSRQGEFGRFIVEAWD